MKEAVTKVIDTLTHEDFDEVLQKLLERFNKCIAAGGDYFEKEYSFLSELWIKVPIQKEVWKLNVYSSYFYLTLFYFPLIKLNICYLTCTPSVANIIFFFFL